MRCTGSEPLASRRDFLARAGLGVGGAALAHWLGGCATTPAASSSGGLPGLPHFAPKAKRVICLFQSGGP
ncbi:MAG: twin-arginine translocation signal domain-containing protein, partial [Opitutia bacterium]